MIEKAIDDAIEHLQTVGWIQGRAHIPGVGSCMSRAVRISGGYTVRRLVDGFMVQRTGMVMTEWNDKIAESVEDVVLKLKEFKNEIAAS